MEVRVADAKTTEALEQDGSLRCLLKIKYKHRDRHSIPAIAWAKRKADEVSRGLLKGAELEAEADGLTVSVNMVSLGDYHHSSYICYDIFLEKCTSDTRDRIDRSTRQPIHVISKRGDILIARRTPRMDQYVAESYEQSQRIDRGPRPYFRDSRNPPHYVIEPGHRAGERVEAPWVKGAEKALEDESEDDGKETEDDNGEAGEDELRSDKALEKREGSGA